MKNLKFSSKVIFIIFLFSWLANYVYAQSRKDPNSSEKKLSIIIAKKGKELAAKEAAIKKLTADLAENKKQLGKQQKASSAKDTRLKELKAKIKQAETASEKNVNIVQLRNIMDRLRKELQPEIDDRKAKFELSKRGIILTVLTDMLFKSGSAKINTKGKITLHKITEVLRDIGLNNQIGIDGHTDNEPIKHSGWKSNWELSSGRALSVLHYFVDNSGLNPGQFSAKGHGKFHPISDNNTEASRRKNRRVEIIIQPTM